MYKVVLECEVITPMFLAGADGRIPEMRAPSIKGAMRFWWRAMNGHLSIESLRKKEAEIFGGSGEEQGKSKVKIKAKLVNSRKSKKYLKEEYDFNWNYDKNAGILTGKDSGIAYLLYSVYLKGNKRFFYKEKTKFKVILSSFDLTALRHAVMSFWALSQFGGLGSRSRRGGGNFIITNIEDGNNVLKDIGLSLFKRKNSIDFPIWLIKSFKNVVHFINSNNNTDFIFQYSNLSFSRFIVSKTSFSSWNEALNNIGVLYKDFRTNNKNDIFGTSAFGLPREHIITSDNKNYKRRCSPLIIKIIKEGTNYRWFVLRFAGEFLPGGVVLKKKKNIKEQRKVNYNKIDDFWNKLREDNSEYILYQPNKLQTVKEKIIHNFSPSKIVLFGSRARGNFGRKSDIDIAIKGSKTPITGDEVMGNLDIIIMEKIDDNFKQKIGKEGVVIWSKDWKDI